MKFSVMGYLSARRCGFILTGFPISYSRLPPRYSLSSRHPSTPVLQFPSEGLCNGSLVHYIKPAASLRTGLRDATHHFQLV